MKVIRLTCAFMFEDWRIFWKISLCDTAFVVGERRFDLFSDKANIVFTTSAAFSSKWLAQAWIIDSFLHMGKISYSLHWHKTFQTSKHSFAWKESKHQGYELII